MSDTPKRARKPRGAASPGWKGGRKRRGKYIAVYDPHHPKATNNYVYEHVKIAEEAFGKTLPSGACVHHLNLDRDDNAKSNLVICENQAYHSLLHVRTRVIMAGGDPSRHKFCWRCRAMLDIHCFSKNKDNFDLLSGQCRSCANATNKAYRQRTYRQRTAMTNGGSK